MSMRYLLVLLLISIASQSHSKKIDLTLLQVNNLHELTSVSGGHYGGLARVETVIKSLKRENKHTYTILSGDLFSPSAIGAAVVAGERVDGRQMVDVLNSMGWNYVTLGRHAFENDREVMLKRFSESKFKIISSNTLDSATGKPFSNTQPTDVFSVKGVRVGLVGIALAPSTDTYSEVLNPRVAAQKAINRLRSSSGVDVVVLMVQKGSEESLRFVADLKGVDLVVGGNEEARHFVENNGELIPIEQVATNARSVRIHRITYDTHIKSVSVQSEIKIISDEIPEDSRIKRVVNTWLKKAFDSFRDDGFDPESIVTVTTETLDGVERNVRNGSTNLTHLVAASALNAFQGADASLVNAGSIRIDDVLPAGPISQYDVIRILPFGGMYQLVSIPGDLLERALNVGQDKKGTGSFLHHSNITQKNAQWLIKGEPLNLERSYKVATTNFLVYRGFSGLEFLVNNPRVKILKGPSIDTRFSLMTKLQRDYPSISILRNEGRDFLAKN